MQKIMINEDNYNTNNNKRMLLIASFLIFLFALGFGLGHILDLQSSSQSSNINISNYSNCTNKTLSNTADCLISYVRPFYNYTKTKDADRTLEDIKENGGDCYDYSLLYIKMAKSLGFKAYQYSFKIDETYSHAIAVIVDKDGYCVLDQLTKPDCVSLI